MLMCFAYETLCAGKFSERFGNIYFQLVTVRSDDNVMECGRVVYGQYGCGVEQTSQEYRFCAIIQERFLTYLQRSY